LQTFIIYYVNDFGPPTHNKHVTNVPFVWALGNVAFPACSWGNWCVGGCTGLQKPYLLLMRYWAVSRTPVMGLEIVARRSCWANRPRGHKLHSSCSLIGWPHWASYSM